MVIFIGHSMDMDVSSPMEMMGGTPFVGVGKLKIALFLKLPHCLLSLPLYTVKLT
jgi:hypothetical protein